MVWLLSFTRFASLTKRIALIVAVEARLRVISPPVMTAATVANGRIGFGIIFVCANFSEAIFQTVGVHRMKVILQETQSPFKSFWSR